MNRWLWVLATLMVVVSQTAIPASAENIQLRADLWCPYNCEPGAEREGYMVDVARRIFERAGHTVEYHALNWARSIQMAKEGRIHGIIGAGKDEVPDFVFPEMELGVIRNTFFVRKGETWRYSGTASLRSRRLGVILGYGYGPHLDDFIERHRKTNMVQLVAGNDALRNNINKLLAGRIDTVLEDNAVFRHVSRDMGVADRIEEAGDDRTYGSINNLYIAFSPNRPNASHFAKILSEGLADMRRTGELAEILAHYGLEDWLPEMASR
jgi:polar amino acid transport system substrate-binding protein